MNGELAFPVPFLVICELLGVPYADREEFQTRSGQLLDLSLPMDERMALATENRIDIAALGHAGLNGSAEDVADIKNPFYPEVLTRLTTALRAIDMNVILPPMKIARSLPLGRAKP